jgi:hypothetical protein
MAGAETSLWPVVVGGLLTLCGTVAGPSFANAELLAFSCKWSLGSTSNDDPTRLFIDRPLRFEVDPQFRKFKAYDEVDAYILGQPEVLLTDTSLKIEFSQPSLVEGLEKPKVTIWISRFDLSSSIDLRSSPNSMMRWYREGRCDRRQF